MKYVISVVMLLLAFNANAISSRDLSGVGFDNLSETQKAEILKSVTEQVAAKTAEPVATKVESASKTAAVVTNQWLDIGERIGKGFAGAAKELGVAANDFVKTPVGIMTASLIVWHFAGSMLVHIFAGIMIFIGGGGLLWYYVKSCRKIERVYDDEKKDVFGRAVLKSETIRPLDDDDKGWMFFMSIVLLATSLITIFTW